MSLATCDGFSGALTIWGESKGTREYTEKVRVKIFSLAVPVAG